MTRENAADELIGETYRRKDGLFDWRIVNRGNHRIQATSGGQGFTERNDAEEGGRRIRDDIEWVHGASHPPQGGDA